MTKVQRQFNGERTVFSKVVLEQLDIDTQTNLDSNRKTFTKINSGWVIELTVKCNIIKLLEDNIEENLSGLGFGDDFLDKMAKAQFMKEKIEKLDFNRMKNLHSEENTAKRMKRQVTDWKNIFIKHMSDKRLVFKIHRELNNKKAHNSAKK